MKNSSGKYSLFPFYKFCWIFVSTVTFGFYKERSLRSDRFLTDLLMTRERSIEMSDPSSSRILKPTLWIIRR